MDANHGRCTASYMDCPRKIQGVGFQMKRSFLAAMPYAPLCPSAGNTCGKSIAHLGQNDNAWSALFVRQSARGDVASFHGQGARPPIDICTAFSQKHLSCIPFAVQPITLNDCVLCDLRGRRRAACSGSSLTTKSFPKKSCRRKLNPVSQLNHG